MFLFLNSFIYVPYLFQNKALRETEHNQNSIQYKQYSFFLFHRGIPNEILANENQAAGSIIKSELRDQMTSAFESLCKESN